MAKIEELLKGDIITAKVPEGPLAEKWTNYNAHAKWVYPGNKRRL